MSDRTQNWSVVVPELAELPEPDPADEDEPDEDEPDEHAASVTAATAAAPRRVRLRLMAPISPRIFLLPHTFAELLVLLDLVLSGIT
jgi:hypothetical protein